MTEAGNSAGPPFRVSHVVLDVDGTLVDYVGALRAATAAAAEQVSALTGSLVTTEQIWRVREQVMTDAAWQGRTNAAMRRESVRRVLEADGVTSDEAVDEVVEVYHRTRDATIAIYPDVVEALDTLRDLGLTLVAASNGNIPLDALGLGQYFVHLHFADEVGISKPDPRFFATALKAVGARAEAAVAVGDRLDNDYEPARAARMHAVLLDRDGRYDASDAIRIRALRELPPLLEPISAPAMP